MLRNINFYGSLLKVKLNAFFRKENGAVDIVAIVILIAIAVGLGLIFKNQILDLIKKIWPTENPSDGMPTDNWG